MRSLKWAAPVALISALALSACGGGGMNPTPAGVAGQSLGAQHHGQPLITPIFVKADKGPKCKPLDNLGCFSDSLSDGLTIGWCLGYTSDPCGLTGDYVLSGATIGNTAKEKPTAKSKMSATWTGPFECTPSTCNSAGEYYLDTINNGPKLTATPKYKYGQLLCIDSSCGSYVIGIDVTS